MAILVGIFSVDETILPFFYSVAPIFFSVEVFLVAESSKR